MPTFSRSLLVLVVVFVGMGIARAGTLAEQFTLSQDTTFQSRVMISAISTAIAVYNEPQTARGHGNRAAFARQLLQNPTAFKIILTVAVATDATVGTQAGSPPVQANVTDAAIANALSSFWDALAGA